MLQIITLKGALSLDRQSMNVFRMLAQFMIFVHMWHRCLLKYILNEAVPCPFLKWRTVFFLKLSSLWDFSIAIYKIGFYYILILNC